MNKIFSAGCPVLLGALLLPGTLRGQSFSFNSYGDTLLGFRKTGTHQGNYELVVNLGPITNFVALAAGTTINITKYSASQLTDGFADGFQDLQWSVSAQFPGSSAWSGYPKVTLWYTVPAPSLGTQSAVPDRLSVNSQAVVQKRIQSMGQGAATISSGLGATNTDNNSILVREPYDANSLNDLTYFIGDAHDPTLGDWGGTVIDSSVENVVPDTFASAARLDLYQSVPSGYTDPTTGSTGPSSYFVGYFVLNTDGTMTFTRASAAGASPPPPSLISIAHSANTSTIYFTTTNGATYTLYYTNAAGLSTPVSGWAASPTTLVGDGNTNSLSDTTSDPVRFYRIGAH